MEYYYDAFLREIAEGKVTDARDAGADKLESYIVTMASLSPQDLCRLFYHWLKKNEMDDTKE